MMMNGHNKLAQDEILRQVERHTEERVAAFQKESDEEGCGAVIGAINAAVWAIMEDDE